MSSTKKGNELERNVYELLEGEIKNDRFYLKKENCKIYSKKGYFSRDREKDIIFDVSIEVYLEDQIRPSLLLLIECKNYNHPVPVDDVEEFFAKVQQVSGANVKAVIASTNSFQDGALKYAASKGIGLLRYYDSSNFNWVLTRSPSSLSQKGISNFMEGYRGISYQEHRSNYFDCYLYFNGNYTTSLDSFFSQLINDGGEGVNHLRNTRQATNFVSYVTEDEMEMLASKALTKIGYTRGAVLVEAVCERQKGLEVEFYPRSERVDPKLLGTITFHPLKISVFEGNHLGNSQIKFTLAHELGHLLLGHDKYMMSEYCHGADVDFEVPPALEVEDIVRLEWQANYFASCLLLPKEQFLTDFLALRAGLGIKDRGHGLLYLDKQKCNLMDYLMITDALIEKYMVSRSVVKIRLMKLGMLVDARTPADPMRIGFIGR